MANENETHKEVCDEMRSFGNVPPMFAWRDLADRAEAAHTREIEIASKYSAEHEARTFDAIRKRDVLIKEFADVLEPFLKRICILCKRYIHGECTAIKEDRCPSSIIQELVAKARKVV